jgi:hypothetical protein
MLRKIFVAKNKKGMGNLSYNIPINYLIYVASGVVRVVKSRRFI